MAMTLTKARADLYNIVDNIILTGRPVEIERKGCIVKIVAECPKKKLDALVKHPGTIVGDLEDIVHMDWSKEWNAGKGL